MAQSTSFFECLCNGSGGRLALGSSVLVYLIAYNETSAPGVLFATLLATLYAAMAARCKSSLRSLQIPYIRASNKFDFGCLFLASWLDVLALMCACSSLARTLSTCLDAMTGGLARILILGRNSPSNEIWPDFLGVAVVFLVTGMFMLGLEHTKAFSFIMTLGMFGLNAVLSAVGWWNGDTKSWQEAYFQPEGFGSFLTASALLTYAFPTDYPTHRVGVQRYMGLFMIALVSVSLILTAACLSSILHFKIVPDYIAVPFFAILDENNFQKLIPAAACLLLLTCSGAFLELFPEFYGIIMRFATSEWRVLSKQISYESSESGNPVLAVFIGGSLCAMLSFACPLENLTYTLAASHLWAGFFRAMYLLYNPFRPKFIQHSNSESSLSYSRLSTAPVPHSCSTSSGIASSSSKRTFWNISLPKQKPPPKKPKLKPKNKKEVEKEWLLLGEPTSPCPQREQRDVESTMLSDGEPPPSDFEYPERFENSDSDTSTDIDAIVDEYRQKIKVTTAGPMDQTARVPTLTSWRVMLFAIFVMACGIALTVAGIMYRWPPAIFTGTIGVFIISLMMCLIPKYSGSVVNVSPVLCCASVLLGVVFFAECAEHSWPGIVLWLAAGLILVLRCDNWCCNCFSPINTGLNEQLIPSVSGKSLGARTTIRLPRPPKNIGKTIPTRVNGGGGGVAPLPTNLVR